MTIERRIDSAGRRAVRHQIFVAAAVAIMVPFDRSLASDVLLAAVGRRSAHRVATSTTDGARVAGRHSGAVGVAALDGLEWRWFSCRASWACDGPASRFGLEVVGWRSW